MSRSIPRLIAKIGGGTVHVYPTKPPSCGRSACNWRPLPVFQAYSAYTAHLDRRNADMVRSPDGPDFILSEHTFAYDGRNLAWESPEAMVAMLCTSAPPPARSAAGCCCGGARIAAGRSAR